MSKLMENDSSDDDDILYSINPDISDVDSTEVEDDNVNGELDQSCELADDEDLTNTTQGEHWSGKKLKPNLPSYDGELKLSTDFESKLPRSATSIDFFQLFFTPELVSYIVDQSNLYRIQTNKTKQGPMTETDFNCLLGFLFYASIVPLPNKRDYWSSYSRQPMVADVITRDRIIYLLSILHFHDNSVEKYKTEKFQPILKYFNDRCKLVVEPEKNLSIDEQMIPYKGTTAPTSFRQYIPNKPTKGGFKVWTRCGVSGFMYEMMFYCGAAKDFSNGPSLSDSSSSKRAPRSTRKKTEKAVNTSDTHRGTLLKEYGSSGLVVLDLIKAVPVGSSIFVDNYFASTKLIQKLTEMGYRVTCTLRSNRLQKCPVSTEKEFDEKERGYYEYFISDNNKCIVIAWKDSKRVLLGSNHIGTEPETIIQRWDKEERCEVGIIAPQIISQYNKFMGGVDTLDMVVALHPIPFKSKRWYIRIIWRIFDLMVINSWIIMNFRRSGDRHDLTSYGSFRLFHFKSEIAKWLLQKPKLQPSPLASFDSVSNESESDEENEPPAKRIRESSSIVTHQIRYDGLNHWPTFISALNATRCKNEKCSKKSYWVCSRCNVHLCLNSAKNCFTQYHTDKIESQ